MTPEMQDAVFDILVEECGAPAIMREEFKLNWPGCIEYRFKGLLGFGGKVWASHTPGGRVAVSCYPEDRTTRRDAIVKAANDRLRALSA